MVRNILLSSVYVVMILCISQIDYDMILRFAIKIVKLQYAKAATKCRFMLIKVGKLDGIKI